MTKQEIDFVKGLMEGVAVCVAEAAVAEHEYRKEHKPHPEYVRAMERTTKEDNPLLREVTPFTEEHALLVKTALETAWEYAPQCHLDSKGRTARAIDSLITRENDPRR